MPKSKPNKAAINTNSREQSRAKKRKGRPSGTRNSMADSAKTLSSGSGNRDPRVGSKKPIPLVVSASPQKKKATKRYATPQAELLAIENDSQVQKLAVDMEQGKTLSAHDQQYFDSKMARHRLLCDLVGTEEEDEKPTEEPGSDIYLGDFHSDLDEFKDIE